MNSKMKFFIILSIFIISLSFMGATFAADDAAVELEASDVDEAIEVDEVDDVLAATTDDVIADDNQLVADFTNDVSEGKDTATVQFTDNSTGNITSWLWDFGDGTNSSDQNPKHVYNTYGIFDVSLTISDNSTSKNIVKNSLIEVYSNNPVLKTGSNGWTRSNAYYNSGDVYQINNNGYISQEVNFDVLNGISFRVKAFSGDGHVSVYVDDEKVVEEAYDSNYHDVNANLSQYTGVHILKIYVTNTQSWASLHLDNINADIVEGVIIPEQSIASSSIAGDNISVTFNDKSIGKINKWFWDFGDGTNSTDKNPTHIYTAPGTYNVNLKVSYNNETKEASSTYKISDLTNLDFDCKVSEGENSTLSAKFNSTAEGVVDTYLWNFGDGTTSAEQNPTHTYEKEGKYTVTFTTTNSIKTTSVSKVLFITLNHNLTANFTNNVNEGKDSFTVQFTDASAGNIATWFWDFGDGTNSTAQNPSHVFNKYGVYNVTLTISNGIGSSDNITQSNFITVYSSNDAIYNPSFLSGAAGWENNGATISTGKFFRFPDNGYALLYDGKYVSQKFNFDAIGDTITFLTSRRNDDSRGTLFVYIDEKEVLQYSIGTNTAYPTTLELNVSQYTGEHTLKVAFTATASGSGAYVDRFTYTANEMNFAALAVNSYSSDGENITVNFLDKSLGKYTNWLWDFGDGNTSTDKNPSHVFTTSGPHDITLTVSYNGTSYNTTKTMYFDELENLTFTANATDGFRSLDVQFNASINGTVEEWYWDFGDGSTSTEQNPVHTYTTFGNFDVIVVASNSITKQTVTKEKLISIVSDLNGNFTINDDSIFVYDLVTFTDLSTGNPKEWLWDFGDGQFSKAQNPTHVYSEAGTYNVTLTISTPFNTTNVSYLVTIKNTLKADFSYSWNSVYSRLQVYDRARNTPHSTGDNIVLRVLDWGDGTTQSFTGEITNGRHTYSNPGIYDVTLTIYDKDNETSTITKKGIVTITDKVPVLVYDIDSFEDNDTCGWVDSQGVSNATYYDRSWGEYFHPASDGDWYLMIGTNGAYKEINCDEVDEIVFWRWMQGGGPFSVLIEDNGVWKTLWTDTGMSHVMDWYYSIDLTNYYGIHKIKIQPTYSNGWTYIDEVTYMSYKDYRADYEIVSSAIVDDNVTLNFRSVAPAIYKGDFDSKSYYLADYYLSTGAITGYLWDFGDGTTSTDKNPTHTFAPGIYQVSLLIKYQGVTMATTTQILDLSLVKVNGTGFSTIQEAIDNATENATIEIAAIPEGKYTENLNINKTLTLNFNGATLAPKDATAPLFNVTNGASVVINDLIFGADSTLATDASSKINISDMAISDAKVTLAGNVDLTNVDVSNAAIIATSGNSTIFNSTLSGNDVAITQTGGNLDIISNLMTDNRIAVNVTGGKTKLQYNLIYNNEAFGLVYIGTGINNTDNWWGNDFPATSFGENLTEDYYDIFRFEDDGVEMDSWLVLTTNATPIMGINKEYPITVDLTKNSDDEQITGYLKTITLPITSDAGDIYDVELVNGTGTTAIFTGETDVEDVVFKVLGKEYDLDASIMTKQDVNINVDGDLVENGTANVTVEIPFASGNVTVIVDGVETSLELNDTKTNFTIDALAPGEHGITVVYAGDDVFGASFASTNFTVAAKEIVTGIIKITGVDGNLTVNGILKDSKDNVMANEVINYQIGDGDIQNTTTATDGSFALTGVNGATITVSYSGNDNIVGSTDSITLSDIASNDENNKTVSDLEKQLSDAKDNATQLNNELADAKDNATQLNSELTDANNKVENLTNELADAKDNATQLNNELTDANNKVENLTSELADAKDKVANLTAQLSDAQNKAPVATVLTPDATEFTRWASDFNAGERGALFYVTLTDVNGNPLANKTIQFAINGKFYNNTTDANGRTGLQINIAPANTYTYAFMFQGDENYSAAPLSQSKLTVKAKTTSISASAKTFKATAKTKKVTVTLKTIKNAYDGKTYLKAGKKLTMKVNGVTYTAKINAKGQATFSIKLTKKGKYSAVIKFAGDRTYAASSKKIQITIK